MFTQKYNNFGKKLAYSMSAKISISTSFSFSEYNSYKADDRLSADSKSFTCLPCHNVFNSRLPIGRMTFFNDSLILWIVVIG